MQCYVFDIFTEVVLDGPHKGISHFRSFVFPSGKLPQPANNDEDKRAYQLYIHSVGTHLCICVKQKRVWSAWLWYEMLPPRRENIFLRVFKLLIVGVLVISPYYTLILHSYRGRVCLRA